MFELYEVITNNHIFRLGMYAVLKTGGKQYKIQKDKYVLFLLRTNEYYNNIGLSHRNEKMEFRNVKYTNYLPTIDYLIEKRI